MNQPIQEGSCHLLIAEDLGPLGKCQIRGNGDASSFITVATSLLIMRPSLAKISNWTKESIRFFIVSDFYSAGQSCGQ